MDASADAKSPIPFGVSWHCFQTRAKYDPSDRAAVCVRNADECDTRRERQSDRADEMVEVGSCREQAKASVLTYFDVMQDEMRFWALPSTEECQATRAFLLRSRDNQRVSGCQLVGKTLPPPGRFGTDLVPPGEGWYCLSAAHKIRGCRRDEASCKGLVDDVDTATCVKLQKASVFTGRDDQGVRRSLSLATTDQCNALRDLAAVGWSDVSLCTIIGDTPRPPIDRTLIPDGAGWYCYTAKARTGGECGRALDDCEGLRALASTNEPSECKKAASVTARTQDGMFYAYPTLIGCHRDVEGETTSSRCESIR